MKILPLEIRQQTFSKTFRGCSAEEVKTFLDAVAQAFEELIRENNSLKDELRRHINQVNDYREKETTLKETMLTAQRISDDMKTSAKKEADLILREAEMKGEQIINEANDRMVKMIDRIQDLKLDKSRFISSLKSLLEQHGKLLRSTEEEEKAIERADTNLTYLDKKSKAKAKAE